jgi:LemA protein
MSGVGKVVLGVVVVALVAIVLVAGVLLVVGVGRYNALVSLHEKANEGRSRFAAAINTASEKMKAVWAMASQEGILEKETYVGVAKARSAYDAAQQAYEATDKNPASSVLDLMTRGAALGQALVNVRVAFEAYPQLRTSETYQKAMVAVEEGFNEIKTALDDWIGLCRGYNVERRSFPTRWLAAAFFGSEFPEHIAYYEGGIQAPEQIKVTADELNPAAKKP